MLLVVPYVHTNIEFATATQCFLFWCQSQPWLMLPLLARLLRMCGPLVNMCPIQSLVLLLMGMGKGKHVQLFRMRRKVTKGFYSTAADAPDGQ